MTESPHPGLQCWNCGQSLADLPKPISRHEHCPKCFEAVHCCRLCRHYRSDASITCLEDRADPPVNKENANFCDWFRPDPGAYSGERQDRSASARSKLDSLFAASDEPAADDGTVDKARDPVASPPSDGQAATPESPISRADAARSKLDSLFSKDD
jgi:hypothetical protein